MLTQSLDQWQTEMKARFPHGSETVAFQCPSCKRETTIKEFKEAGVSEQLAPQECIGRHVQGLGCDWTAYGLMKTMGYGRSIIMPDGKIIEVFDFAQKP